jgi:hypothetical protein
MHDLVEVINDVAIACDGIVDLGQPLNLGRRIPSERLLRHQGIGAGSSEGVPVRQGH